MSARILLGLACCVSLALGPARPALGQGTSAQGPSAQSRAAAVAPAQDAPGEPVPRGSVPVLIGRLYHGGPGGTRPVGIFGLRLSGGAATTRVSVAADGDVPAYQLDVTARLKGTGALVDWALVPGEGATVDGAAGERRLERGTLGHVPVANAAGTEIFASLEHDRASAFAYDRLERHFRPAVTVLGAGATDAAVPPAPAAGSPASPAPVGGRPPAPVAGAPPAGVSASPAPGVPGAAGAGGHLVLEFRLEQDGRTRFAPRVRVREGERFEVRGGEPVRAGSGLFDGFELTGRATRRGGACVVDLSVQSGRRLDDATEAAWLVDRFRSQVGVPVGGEVVLELFEDVPDLGGGRTTLECRCAVE